MSIVDILFIALAPWGVFVVFAVVANLLIKLARKRRAIAVAFGIFVQMFSPDPYVENTIKMVQVDKRVVKRASNEEQRKNNSSKKA